MTAAKAATEKAEKAAESRTVKAIFRAFSIFYLGRLAQRRQK